MSKVPQTYECPASKYPSWICWLIQPGFWRWLNLCCAGGKGSWGLNRNEHQRAISPKFVYEHTTGTDSGKLGDQISEKLAGGNQAWLSDKSPSYVHDFLKIGNSMCIDFQVSHSTFHLMGFSMYSVFPGSYGIFHYLRCSM